MSETHQEDEPGRGSWSTYRWGVLKALEDLAKDGEKRGKDAREALASAEERIMDELRSAEARLEARVRDGTRALSAQISELVREQVQRDKATSARIAELDRSSRAHESTLAGIRARSALLGGGLGSILGALAGALAGKLIHP